MNFDTSISGTKIILYAESHYYFFRMFVKLRFTKFHFPCNLIIDSRISNIFHVRVHPSLTEAKN
jgi:hypothetical protein